MIFGDFGCICGINELNNNVSNDGLVERVTSITNVWRFERERLTGRKVRSEVELAKCVRQRHPFPYQPGVEGAAGWAFMAPIIVPSTGQQLANLASQGDQNNEPRGCMLVVKFGRMMVFTACWRHNAIQVAYDWRFVA